MDRLLFWLALVLVTVPYLHGVTSDENCNRNLKPEAPGEGLAFSKELRSRDSAKQTTFKTLRCCVRHYETIEWYKDGLQLTLTGDVGSDGISFVTTSEHNQSLSAIKVHASDSGNYTCIARNGSKSINHTVELGVYVHDTYNEPPVMMTVPEDQWALPRESANFCCEAFIGCGNTSQQLGTVSWITSNTNAKLIGHERENGQALRSCLIFDSVKDDDYGLYLCNVSNGRGVQFVLNATLHNGVNPHAKIRTTYKITVVMLLVFVTVWTVLGTTYIKWRLHIHLFWKDRFGKLEENDGKLYDVFVCYDSEDSEFVLGVLVPVLETRYNYTTCAWERNSLAGDWIPETYPEMVRQSRRFLMVLSPALTSNNWCTYALYVAVENMLSLHSHIICITLKDVKCGELTVSETDPKYLTLNQVLRIIKNIQWDPGQPHKAGKLAKGSNKFWKNLRLYLPPRRAMLYQNHEDTDSVVSSVESLL